MIPFSKKVELMDLIPGINQRVAEGVLSEMGVDMSCFPSHGHAASWTAFVLVTTRVPGNAKVARSKGKSMAASIFDRSQLVGRSKEGNVSVCPLLSVGPPPREEQGDRCSCSCDFGDDLPYSQEPSALYELGSDYFNKLNAAYVQPPPCQAPGKPGFKVILEPLPKLLKHQPCYFQANWWLFG